MRTKTPKHQPLKIAGETLLPQQQASRSLAVTIRTLESWRARRIGPAWTRIGGRVYYREAALLDWIRAQEQQPVAEGGAG